MRGHEMYHVVVVWSDGDGAVGFYATACQSSVQLMGGALDFGEWRVKTRSRRQSRLTTEHAAGWDAAGAIW